MLAVALAALAAAACLSRRALPFSLAGAAVVLAALVLHDRTGLFNIRSAPTKGMYRHMAAEPGARRDLTGWNSYSRIDTVTGFPRALARLYIDSDAWTDLHRWDGRVESIATAKDWFRALPFRLVPQGRTLVIGPGGGSDVLVALASGHRVTAVELNPLVLRFVRSYGAQAGNIYDHPLVETHLSEGRTFLARSADRFDVVFLGFVDSWASVASGGLSLSENYLYTTGGFRAYLDHLTEDGALVIMRWRTDVPRLAGQRGGGAGTGRGGAAGRGGDGARRHAGQPAADDLHAAAAPVHGGGGRGHPVVAERGAADRARPAGGAARGGGPALGPHQPRRIRSARGRARRTRHRRPALLLRAQPAARDARRDGDRVRARSWRPIVAAVRGAGVARAAARRRLGRLPGLGRRTSPVSAWASWPSSCRSCRASRSSSGIPCSRCRCCSSRCSRSAAWAPA